MSVSSFNGASFANKGKLKSDSLSSLLWQVVLKRIQILPSLSIDFKEKQHKFWATQRTSIIEGRCSWNIQIPTNNS